MNLTEICTSRTFSIDECNEFIPLLEKLTKISEENVDKLLREQRYCIKSGASQDKINSYDKLVVDELNRWGTKITKLGMKAYRGGYVGFDSGFGFWSWHSGEKTVDYYHDYDEDPWKRRKILIVGENNAPQT